MKKKSSPTGEVNPLEQPLDEAVNEAEQAANAAPVVPEPTAAQWAEALKVEAQQKRRIRVNRAYRAPETGEQPVLPGLYAPDDPALLGIAADWLVAHQYGEWA